MGSCGPGVGSRATGCGELWAGCGELWHRVWGAVVPGVGSHGPESCGHGEEGAVTGESWPGELWREASCVGKVWGARAG